MNSLSMVFTAEASNAGEQLFGRGSNPLESAIRLIPSNIGSATRLALAASDR